MAKAFDKVDWNFLIAIMKRMELNSHWCGLIHQYISTTTSDVLVNGSPNKFFKPSRGLRQGDSLSPYLFVFCMEALSRTLSHAEDLGIITGIKIRKNTPPINHLLFADVCMVFCKVNKIESQNLMDIFKTFSETSGQLINFNKSGVFFRNNTDPNLSTYIRNDMRVQFLNLHDKYMGSPLFTHKSKILSFRLGVDKLKQRLISWKNSPLNPAGRHVLISSITSTTSIYQMKFFKFPKKTFQDLNKLQRDFFWVKAWITQKVTTLNPGQYSTSQRNWEV
ncbi:uncharacterized protein LOC113352263 [Papaver somniferum]|uniref:uncharacterized protein LOC113352263 n=1 Tax=Papaver somniferum TaxID=3469 RepID=UPI000E6F7DF7|nr:uncharacterized protein LOC113352263 [Papaver somniferum]